jgi:hypothetical protein
MKKQGLITLATTFVTTQMHPNEHHVLYIVMDETTKFTWHMSWTTFFLCEKNHIFL